jgi:hypothetical protein
MSVYEAVLSVHQIVYIEHLSVHAYKRRSVHREHQIIHLKPAERLRRREPTGWHGESAGCTGLVMIKSVLRR